MAGAGTLERKKRCAKAAVGVLWHRLLEEKKERRVEEEEKRGDWRRERAERRREG